MISFKRLLPVTIALFSCLCAPAAIHVVALRVQSRIDPLGIETAAPCFSWQWQTERRGSFQMAYRLLVASSKEKLRQDIGDIWNPGKVNGDEQQYVTYKGQALRPGKTYYWKVKIWDNYHQASSWSDMASFTMGILDPSGWKAKWISCDTAKATAEPIFRKPFVLAKNIRSAVAYISGLGYYELYLNGSKIGDHVLDPGQTNYDDYALYVTYDITRYLKKGNNMVGVMLGDGWYSQNKVWGAKGLQYGHPLMICQLEVEYTDGSRDRLLSDESWQWANGPVIKSNVYAGEVYAAQKEIAGWSTAAPAANAKADPRWMPARLAEDHPPELRAQSLPPIRRMKELPAKKLYKVAKGTYIFDFGQNFAGWTRLAVTAPAGTTITIQTAEEVSADGRLDPSSTGVFATKVVQTEKYTCKGGGKEIWEPRFTYHGFRYAEVTGLPEAPQKDLLTGIVVYSSVDSAGAFACSNEQINRLHRLAQWTLTSNLHSVPTDCPTREKCGWLGDAHAMATMSIYNYGMETFLTKYLYDIRSSAQRQKRTIFFKTWDKHYTGIKPKGIPFMIAPGKRDAGVASPDWGTTVVQIPWYLYLYYGNKAVLREFYPDMKKWVNYVNGLARSHIVDQGLGDWCPPGGVVPKEPPMPLTSTVFHYLDLEIMEQAASVLGLPGEARQFALERDAVKKAFQDRFYDPQKKSFGAQTANAMALDAGLAPASAEKAVSNKIAELSKDSLDGFLNTGIFGLERIFNALSHYGNENAAYAILTKKGYNSFAYMWSAYNATTLWEILPVDSFYLKNTDKGWERSHNHPMQGGYDKWFYENVLGIRPRPDAPGFKKIHLEPEMTGQLSWAKGAYQSGFGVIASAWRRAGDSLYWNVTVPANTSATLYLPSRSVKCITEGGMPVAGVKDIRLIEVRGEKIVCRVGSGVYSFAIKLDK